ncbi:MAG: Asp-tRNA(Asn)/Glu-tRNA(Gln) amidotransferase GatCAB subunit [Bacilli bacterium]|nr:Asp-tRNA(Asn)/Glu-tRNA(Gln) amidotransferase GatCAB subunit [Bacilli bacterium]
MNKQLADMSIQELAPKIENKEISPVELVEACLQRIEETEGDLNAYISILGDQAREQARQSETEIVNGFYRGTLHGIPFAAKDLYATKGIKTTAGSKIFQDFVPDYDSTTVTRLIDAGAILVGKNNTHEFASGGTNENEHFGPARNPWNPQMIPGGSSGGSAAAVASSSAVFSLGTDTGGSIRMPAALCGIVGIKATYGRVSRKGVFPLSWSLDHAGPLTKSVWDAATVLSVLAGYDPMDPTSSDEPVPDYASALESGGDRPLAGLRIGWCQAYYFDNLDPEVKLLIDQAMLVLSDLGADIREVKIPYLEQMVQVHSFISAAEMYAIHAQNFSTRSEDFGSNIRPRIETGKEIPAGAYLETQRLRQNYQEVWSNVYQEIDLLVAPTTAIPAFQVGAESITLNGQEVNPRDLGILGRTAPSNFNGYPAISVPCGYTTAGLPVGLQIQGTPFEESLVFQAAYAYEMATAWLSKKVPLVNLNRNERIEKKQEVIPMVKTEKQNLDVLLPILAELSKSLPADAEPAAFFTPKKVSMSSKLVELIR